MPVIHDIRMSQCLVQRRRLMRTGYDPRYDRGVFLINVGGVIYAGLAHRESPTIRNKKRLRWTRPPPTLINKRAVSLLSCVSTTRNWRSGRRRSFRIARVSWRRRVREGDKVRAGQSWRVHARRGGRQQTRTPVVYGRSCCCNHHDPRGRSSLLRARH